MSIVTIAGGGAGRDYDGTKLAADGIVVVTINYRLGALGFLAHPALASRPGGASGNYGLMDQQAALRWVQDNIRQFGGDPHNVTIAGQSSGGTSVLAHLISRGSQGLFHRAIVQSGSFAYLFDLPDAPLQGPLDPGQQALAASMRAGWANFAASGNPASAAVPWPAFGADSMQMLSLVPPRPQVETDFAARHHCAFWAAG